MPFKKLTTIMAESAKFTYNEQGGSRRIEFPKMSMSPGQTTGIDCEMAFSLL